MILLYLNGKRISLGQLKATLGSIKTMKLISEAKNNFLSDLNTSQSIEIPGIGYLVIMFDLQFERMSA